VKCVWRFEGMDSSITVAMSPRSKFYSLLNDVMNPKINVIKIESQGDIDNIDINVLFIDENLLQDFAAQDWHESDASLLIQEGSSSLQVPNHALFIPLEINIITLEKLIFFAAQHHQLRKQQKRLNASLDKQDSGIEKLVEIGIALSTENDLDKLLAKILNEGMKLVDCDAASLFLLDREDKKHPELKFKLTKNQSLSPSFEEQSIPLTESSVVGHTAISGQALNIADAYNIDPSEPYQFNRSFDKVMGYKTVSLIAIPMLDHNQQVVGVLEFINRKKNPQAILKSLVIIEDEVIPFDSSCVDLLRALSSQAAVAIESKKLLGSINRLFDGFVNASVFAIEQRDPTTSGHSFRVANLCEILAQSVNTCSEGVLHNVTFNSDQYRELRFAALLHDFGKVGVREHVLTKAKKLTEDNIELLHYRLAFAKQQLKNQHLNQIIKIYEQHGSLSNEIKSKLSESLNLDLAQLDHYMEVILSANEPSVLPQERFAELENIRSHMVTDYTGSLGGFISEHELAALSIPRGSLNEQERIEIESHVSHTLNFLKLIPWTSELSQIPNIAGAHHEKLDGSGYPNHLKSDKIPYQSRVMTVCDIYDALTASDRPYKPALPINKALSILESEAKSGMLDINVVKVFIDSKSFDKVEGYVPKVTGESSGLNYVHHVCDMDFHKH